MSVGICMTLLKFPSNPRWGARAGMVNVRTTDVECAVAIGGSNVSVYGTREWDRPVLHSDHHVVLLVGMKSDLVWPVRDGIEIIMACLARHGLPNVSVVC